MPRQTHPPYPRPLCMARPPIIHHLFISLLFLFHCLSTYWDCTISSSNSGQRSILQVIQRWQGLGILIKPHGSWKVAFDERFKVCFRCLQVPSILVEVENYAVALHTVGVPHLPRLSSFVCSERGNKSISVISGSPQLPPAPPAT